MKVMLIFGTRPEAIKMAPLVKAFESDSDFETVVTVTAQHREMLDQVLDLFSIEPKYDLKIMKKAQSLSDVTTRVLLGLEKILKDEKPDLVLVHGDTTTTFAGALASFYSTPPIPCGHVEAGLRSFDKMNPYPEEVNRILTDHLCKYYFAPTKNAQKNLLSEGIKEEDITITGNTVVDALKQIQKINKDLPLPVEVGKNEKLVTITMHRRESWGKPLESVCRAILRLHTEITNVRFIFPWHMNPKVREIISPILSGLKRVHLVEPLDYQNFLNLMDKSYLIMSDSGGIQEEAASLSVPVLLLRHVTERPEALDCGICKLVGTDEQKVFDEAREILTNEEKKNAMIPDVNPFGDGTASIRIKNFIAKKWGLN